MRLAGEVKANVMQTLCGSRFVSLDRIVPISRSGSQSRNVGIQWNHLARKAGDRRETMACGTMACLGKVPNQEAAGEEVPRQANVICPTLPA